MTEVVISIVEVVVEGCLGPSFLHTASIILPNSLSLLAGFGVLSPRLAASTHAWMKATELGLKL